MWLNIAGEGGGEVERVRHDRKERGARKKAMGLLMKVEKGGNETEGTQVGQKKKRDQEQS